MAVPLPMFPLGTALFPHEPLPLHVFEPRYRALARDCHRGDGRLGVVLIERGSEVGGGDTRFAVGTAARLVEAAELPDGRWHLLVVGDHRIKVTTWLPDDPYPVGLVEDLDDAPLEAADGALVQRAGAIVRETLRLARALGLGVPPPDVAVADDLTTAAWQLAAIAPLGPLDKQRLLEQDSAGTRLELLAELAGDAAAVLAYRLGDG
ncbi:MAG TPA: LON peptidase substrate-binding domain-containing protein [Acidimicrobiales bacterium]|nr:LON peptidase substrate-binding domain-containing protein [Acidimicrobiales bacterium]